MYFRVHADTLYGLPDIYAQKMSAKPATILINAFESSFNQKQSVLLNNYAACIPASSDAAQFILNHRQIEIFQLTQNKIGYICVLNRPGENVINFSAGNLIVISLQPVHANINVMPTFADLLFANDLKVNSDHDESEIPKMTFSHRTETSLVPENLICHTQAQSPVNVLLGKFQPVKLQTNFGLINRIQLSNPARAVSEEDKTPYKPLVANLSNDLQPQLLAIKINGNTPISDTPELIYLSNKVACFSDEQLDNNNIGNNHSLFYEYFQPNSNPLIDSSLKCVVNTDSVTNFSADVQSGFINIILSDNSTQAQNINLGTNNEPVYPSGQIYANSTSYQITGSQNPLIQANQPFQGTFTNTQATPFGSLMNGVTGGVGTLNRSYTYWQTDFLKPMTSLIVGDTIPIIGNWGGSAAFSGVQYGSNEALRPGYFFTATPIISGSVNVPTTAEVLLNGAQTNSINLPAGQFNLYNLPILNGDGTVTVNVKDPNSGVVQSINLPYYSSPKVLTNTTYLYQYSLGVPQNGSTDGFTFSNYNTGTPVASTQHFVGITNNYTLELHGEAQTANFGNFGISHNNIWFNKFATSLTTAMSASESAGNGYLLGFNFSRQSSLPNTLGWGININYYTNNFAQLGQLNGQEFPLQQTIFANYMFGNNLSASLGYSKNQSLDSGQQMSILNASLSWQLVKNVMLSSTSAITNQMSTNMFATNLGVTITFAGSQSLTSNYSYQDINDTPTNSYNVNYQYNAPTNIWGGSVGGTYDGTNLTNPNGINGSGYYLFKNFNVNAQGNYRSNTNYNYSGVVSGNAVISGSGLNFGQYTSLSYIIVKVGNLAGIGIKQNGTIVGSTDSSGSFLIPNISPYLPQDIEVNASDLPFNIQLDSYEKRIVAPLNGGAKVSFYPVKYVAANAVLRYDNNKIPPTGYTADLYSSLDPQKPVENIYIVDNGTIQLTKYSSDLTYRLEFTVKTGTYTCSINKSNIVQANSNEYLTDLGTLQCTKKPSS